MSKSIDALLEPNGQIKMRRDGGYAIWNYASILWDDENILCAVCLDSEETLKVQGRSYTGIVWSLLPLGRFVSEDDYHARHPHVEHRGIN